MRCLAFDCSSSSLSIALVENHLTIAEKTLCNQASHSELLVYEINNLLQQNNLNFFDLDLAVSTNGPGSFTAIRVALATLKTIQIATKIPCFSITASEVMAFKYRQIDSPINVIIEANNSEVYYAKYRIIDQETAEIIAPIIINNDKISELIAKNEFVCGLVTNKNLVVNASSSGLDDRILGSEVANLGIKKFVDKNFSSHILPLYLREPNITLRKKKL